ITVADAETITSVEAGVKADLFDRRGRVAFSVYDYTVKDQQLTAVGGASNAAKLLKPPPDRKSSRLSAPGAARPGSSGAEMTGADRSFPAPPGPPSWA
ncbi:MAG: hypothetical protein ABGW82_02680, partial [Paracoccus sp. (in: a-proteobacteria)]